MGDRTRPLLVLYVVWHPAFVAGAGIAELLRQHYRRELYQNVAGGTGLSVVFRSTPAPGSPVPLQIDLAEADATAVVVLAESSLVNDGAWVSYVRALADQTEEAGLTARVFPVAVDETALSIGFEEQAIRWDRWLSDSKSQVQRLLGTLTYQLCRMLRHYLEHLRHPTEEEEALEKYLAKVQVFLSHTKRDDDGERIAKLVREHLYSGEGGGLSCFFDVYDIPAGTRFSKVLLKQVRQSAVVAIHTDVYSSREWCRREIIEAKLWNVPLVVANCLGDQDERGFPYLGNVPIVRMDPLATDRIDVVVGRLLDEVLKDFIWRCRIALLEGADAGATFLPRPPELISLAGLEQQGGDGVRTLVYPDPPLSAEEERLFEAVAPRVRLVSLTQWLAECGL